MKENWEIRYGTFLLAAALFLSFYAALGMAPLFDLDEGAFSEATREMLLSHNYVTTYLNHELRFDKPILIYWLQAASVSIFGAHEFAFRLPSAIAATLWALAIHRFARRWLDPVAAFWAVFTMATSLQITIIAKAAIADALLNMFIALSMFALFDYLKSGRRFSLDVTFAAIGLGTLTKGPVAILIPLAVFFLYSLIRREMGRFLRIVFDVRGIAIFLIVALPWYIAEYMDQGMRFVEGFLLKHNLSRFKTSFEGHSGSLFYYIPVLLVGLLPYTTLMLRSLWEMWRRKGEKLWLFMGLWFLFVFLFFSLSGTKLPHYVIYGYTPLFLAMAATLKTYRGGWGYVLPSILLFVPLLFLPEIVQMAKKYVHDLYVGAILEAVPEYVGWGYRLFFTTAILLLALLAWRRVETKITTLVLGFAMIFGVNFFVIPLYGNLAQMPIKEAAQYVKSHDLRNIVMYRLNMPSFIVYSGRFVQKRTPHIGDTVLTKISALKEIGTIGHYEILYEKNGIVLLKIER